MASTLSNQGSARRLAELLDKQQEPFVLEIYLLERGYRVRKSLELEGSRIIGCCSISDHNHKNKSNKYLKKSWSYHLGMNPLPKRSSAQLSHMARGLLNKLVPRKGRRTGKQKEKEKEIEGVKAGRCSSVSCSTTLSNNTWSESDTDVEMISMSSPAKSETTHHDQSASDRVMTQWRFVEENKQCSPVSVLDEIDLLQAIPIYNVKHPHEDTAAESRIRFQKKVSENAILSASLWELLVQFRSGKQKQKPGRQPFPEYMNSKKALQQNRQVLFDCVRDAVENGNRQKSSSNSNCEKGLKMGSEEIGKIICKNLKTWGKLSTNETNIKEVLKMDLFAADEWGGSEVWRREIAAEVENYIIDDITEEIIKDMIDQ